MADRGELKNLVAEGKTAKAIDLIIDTLEQENDRDLANQAISLKSRHRRLQQNINNMLITSDNAGLESNRINIALLSIIDDMPDSPTTSSTQKNEPASDEAPILTLEMVKEMELNEVMTRIQKLMDRRKMFQDELDIASDASQKFNLSENIKKMTAEIELLKERLS